MKSISLAAATIVAANVSAHAENWVPDPGHTEVVIEWNHAGFSMQTAKFLEVEGALEFTPGDVANASADFSVIVSSIDTGVPQFDSDLLSENFFDAENYPAIRFVSTSVEQTGEMTVEAAGELTIKDVTKPVIFEITVHKIGEHPVGQFFDYYKGEWMGMTAKTSINRSDFGVDAFIPVGSDQVDIVINTEMRAGGWE